MRRRDDASLDGRLLVVHVVGLRQQQQQLLLLFLLLMLWRRRQLPLLLLLRLLLLQGLDLPLLLLRLAVARSKRVPLDLPGTSSTRLAGFGVSGCHCRCPWCSCLGMLQVVLVEFHFDAMHGDGVNAVDLQPLRRAADVLPIAATYPPTRRRWSGG